MRHENNPFLWKTMTGDTLIGYRPENGSSQKNLDEALAARLKPTARSSRKSRLARWASNQQASSV